MWQFSGSIDGMASACRALGFPVIGGNVSFYNESRGRDIDPTPIVGVVGVIDELTDPPPPPALFDGDAVVLLGTTGAEVGGSEWATRHGLRTGAPPSVDLAAAALLHDLVRALVTDRAVRGVHDCSDGGLAVAIAEMTIAGDVGAQLELARAGGVEWFSESASRVLLSVSPDRLDAVLARAAAAGVPAARIGTAGGDRLVAPGSFDVAVAVAAAAWRGAIPRALGNEPAPA
jgi:phosphoribosylformylglycinamidine synthase